MKKTKDIKLLIERVRIKFMKIYFWKNKSNMMNYRIFVQNLKKTRKFCRVLATNYIMKVFILKTI